MPKPASVLRIGVYIIPPVQFLDVSPVDIFGCMSREYFDYTELPESVKSLSLDEVQIKYISPDGPAKEPMAKLTASAALRVDHSIHDPEVKPGAFDILMIPGPPPTATFTEEQLNFVRGHWNNGKGAAVMSVCTGSMVVAASGIAKGRTGSCPRSMIPEFKKKYPETKWVDKRWARDDSGKLWMSGGVTNGQEMVAAYLRENYPGPFTDIVLAMTDTGERGQEYQHGAAATGLWWLFAIIRSWLKSESNNGKANN